MKDLVEFLNARLDAAEETARSAGESRIAWLSYRDDQGHLLYTTVADGHGGVWVADGKELPEPSTVLVVYDTADVLADIEAKRRIVADHSWWKPAGTETDAELHRRCAHPDYEYATTEGRRKAWDEADEPPYGDDAEPDHTWERNVDCGRDGWERFDHTEESYWRRRLPEDQAAKHRAARDLPPLTLRLLALPYAGHPDYDEAWRP